MNIPEELWQAFKEHRRKLKAPLTFHAENLIKNRLDEFARQGYDPKFCLEESIVNGWKGVFPRGERRLVDQNGQQYWITKEGTRSYYQ